MELNPEQLSAEAVQKTKNAQQAIELAREAQIARAVEETARRTKADVLEVIQQVFGQESKKDPGEMKILVQRIPILCTQIVQMHNDIAEMKDSQKWATRIVVGLFIAAVAKMIFIP